jgi:predicted Zn-dependent protease
MSRIDNGIYAVITRRALRLTVGALPALILFGCSLGLVSEREVSIQADEQFEQMRAEVPISNDVEARSYIVCVANAIIATLEPPYSELDWDIEVFDDDMINAFAMPGGKIGVFTGILKAAKNQDQLGSVLGHEVAHVTEQHSVERANRTMTTQYGAVAMDAVLGSGDIVQTGAQLGILLPYGRGQESEADTVGLDYMADAGFDPRASVQLWKNMAEENKGAPPEFLSTHPSSDSRISDLVRQLPASLNRYNAAKEAGKNPECGP